MSPRSGCISAIISGCLTALESLRNLGNTVLVVEHDEETIRHADYVLDLGPGAGKLGGACSRGGDAGGDHDRLRGR